MKSLKGISLTILALGLGSHLADRASGQDVSFVDTKHNLSVSGTGEFRALHETRMCIFCHTPHRGRTSAPLWNREDSTQSYLEYNSSTFGGITSQPDGSSKLCLSCHDGSIALGLVVNDPREIEMVPGHTRLDRGSAFIGTNLRDDHPISFDYSSSEGGRGPDYLRASSITPPVHLDMLGRVQCTSCHDPHRSPFGDFLLASDRYSGLCLSCHTPKGWTTTSHSTSAATWNGARGDPWIGAKYSTVAENGCANCHRPHNAGRPARLLAHAEEEENCLRCHNGSVSALDITIDLNKPYGHNPFLTQGVHDPSENPVLMGRHSECEDCHDPHSSFPGAAAPPAVPGPLNGVSGMSSTGQPIDEITRAYELCYKCHSSSQGATTYVPRQAAQTNLRLEFNPSNPSFHPIESPGAGSDVPSLLPPWTTASVMSCGDCHQSDSSPTFGGTGPAGPHGSMFRPLLGANYSITDNTLESVSAYSLCYRCHNRSSILSDVSFSSHRLHVVDARTPCSACHDPHGVASQPGGGDSTHLVNFDTSIVSGLAGTGALYFRDGGFRRGTCTLTCHGYAHDDTSY